MIEPIGIEEKKENEEVITATIDETAESSVLTCSNESTDDVELETVNVEPDAQVSINEPDSLENDEQSDDSELVSEETLEENEDKKQIEELSAALERERAEHKEEVDSLKKEIVSLSPLPNFEKEMLEELIALREGYFRMKRNYEEKEEDFFNKEKTLRLIDDVASQLETILFNYSVEMYISKTQEAKQLFQRFAKINLPIKNLDGTIDARPFEVQAVDDISSDGVMVIYLKEDFSNKYAAQEDITPPEETIPGDDETPSALITGPSEVYPYDTIVYTATQAGGSWAVDSEKAVIIADKSNDTQVTIDITTGRSGKFNLIYNLGGVETIYPITILSL